MHERMRHTTGANYTDHRAMAAALRRACVSPPVFPMRGPALLHPATIRAQLRSIHAAAIPRLAVLPARAPLLSRGHPQRPGTPRLPAGAALLVPRRGVLEPTGDPRLDRTKNVVMRLLLFAGAPAPGRRSACRLRGVLSAAAEGSMFFVGIFAAGFFLWWGCFCAAVGSDCRPRQGRGGLGARHVSESRAAAALTRPHARLAYARAGATSASSTLAACATRPRKTWN
jgi:hypothetical protein